MAVKILIWNIKFFSRSNIQQKGRGTKVVNQIHPAGAAMPNYDLFIIVEPNKYPQPTDVGDVPLSGSSVEALQILLYALRNRNAGWRLVPPRTVSTDSTKEVHGVYYYSPTLRFDTLESPLVASGAAAVANVPPLLTNMGVMAAPSAYGGANITVASGAVMHSPDANPATLANEVDFPSRRPFRNRFTELVGLNTFDIYSSHTAPDSDYPGNVNGVEQFSNVYNIQEGRTARVIFCGDLNCCTFDPCPNKPSGHYNDELNAQDILTSDGAAAYKHWVSTRDAITAAIALTDAFCALPWAGIQAATPLAASVDTYTLRAKALAAFLAQVHTHASAVHTVESTNAAFAGLLTNASQAVTQLGVLPAVGTATNLAPLIATAKAAALAARDAGLALTDFLGNNFSAPIMLEKQAVSAKQTANAQDAARAGNAAATVAAVKAVGIAVQEAMDTFFQSLGTALSNTTETSATNAKAAKTTTPNLLVLATTARDNLRLIEPLLFKTHIKELSSLKTSYTATEDDYRSHAFDQILTLGFASVADAKVIDRVRNDPRYAATMGNPADFTNFFQRHFKGPGSGSAGISDHLPVQITVTQ